MKTKEGTCIGLFEGSTDLPPLTMGLATGVTLVRMNAGTFKVQVHTQHKTIVNIKMGDVSLIDTKVGPGISLFALGSNSEPLSFIPVPAGKPAAVEAPAPSVVLGIAGLDEDYVSTTPIVTPFVGPAVTRLRVSLSYYHEDHGATVTQHVFSSEERLLQLNTPGDHDRAVLENLYRLAPSLDESERARGPFCACCRQPVSPDQVVIEIED